MNSNRTSDQPVRLTSSRYEDAFENLLADNTVNRLDIPGTYDFNTARHRFIDDLNTGGGTFIKDIADTDNLTNLAGKFQVTASAGEEHLFGGRERFRYVPNYEMLFGMSSWAESDLSEGQHFAIELSNDAGDNGYRYHFEGTATGYNLTLEQFQGSTTPVYSVAAELDHAPGFDPAKPTLARCFVNWYGVGAARFTLSYPDVDENGAVLGQLNPIIGRTANRDDVATDVINLRVQTRVWCEAGAEDLTVNMCSIGALIRGNATQVDREKVGIFYEVGGNISQYPTDNVADAMAARIDPDRPEVVVNMLPPIFAPTGNDVLMELGVYAVHQDDPDLTVNFNDPDDDGTDEGPSPAAQSREQTDVMQYTRDVTSIPTTTDIRADGTTGLVPDMRHLTTTVSESGQGSGTGAGTAGELEGVKRLVHEDDVVIFLPRTNPAGTTTSGLIKYFKPIFEQDW